MAFQKHRERLMDNKEQLNELHLSLFGKIFYGSVAAWLLGKMVNLKFRGSRQQAEALASALVSSKKFQDELERPGATVESVVQKLGVKHMSAAQFERTFGVPWPL